MKKYQAFKEFINHTLLNPDISCLENSVDPDQLASQRQLIRTHTFFHSSCDANGETSQFKLIFIYSSNSLYCTGTVGYM